MDFVWISCGFHGGLMWKSWWFNGIYQHHGLLILVCRKIKKNSIPIIGKMIMNFMKMIMIIGNIKFWEALLSSFQANPYLGHEFHGMFTCQMDHLHCERSGVVFGSLHKPPSIIHDLTGLNHGDGNFCPWGIPINQRLKWVCWGCWQRIWLGIQLSGWTTSG